MVATIAVAWWIWDRLAWTTSLPAIQTPAVPRTPVNQSVRLSYAFVGSSGDWIDTGVLKIRNTDKFAFGGLEP